MNRPSRLQQIFWKGLEPKDLFRPPGDGALMDGTSSHRSLLDSCYRNRCHHVVILFRKTLTWKTQVGPTIGNRECMDSIWFARVFVSWSSHAQLHWASFMGKGWSPASVVRRSFQCRQSSSAKCAWERNTSLRSLSIHPSNDLWSMPHIAYLPKGVCAATPATIWAIYIYIYPWHTTQKLSHQTF